MEEQILKEIKELRLVLAQVIGTSEQPADQQFSNEAISKAAAEFQKLSIERGEWVSEHEIDKIIKNAPYSPGKFIIEKFVFTNYFIKGKSLYFNKKDLLSLNRELKLRNINLGRYMELVESQEKFKKRLKALSSQRDRKRNTISKYPMI
jgi:hypothetical protein